MTSRQPCPADRNIRELGQPGPPRGGGAGPVRCRSL